MVRVQELPTPRDAVDGIAKAARDPAVDFVEGIIFGHDRALTMTASMCAPESLESNLSTVVLPDDGRYIDVVCRHLDESRANWHSKNVSCSFRMSTFDFLYRWDCDIFWATRRTNFLGVPAVSWLSFSLSWYSNYCRSTPETKTRRTQRENDGPSVCLPGRLFLSSRGMQKQELCFYPFKLLARRIKTL